MGKTTEVEREGDEMASGGSTGIEVRARSKENTNAIAKPKKAG